MLYCLYCQIKNLKKLTNSFTLCYFDFTDDIMSLRKCFNGKK